jgi:serpin B
MLTRRDALRSLLLTGAAAAAGPTLAACGSAGSGARAAAPVALPTTGRTRGDGSARAAAETVQDFGADLYRRLAPQPGNLACSPYSIALALAMTRNGARGRTAAEMDRVLRAPTLPLLNSGLSALTRQVESRAGSKKVADGSFTDVAVGVANSLWGQQGVPWEPPFLDALARGYSGGLRVVDYRRPDVAAARINAWVAERTRQRIRKLVPAEALDETTRLVLVNAMYVKAAWQHRFDPRLTSRHPFTRADGAVVTVPTMSNPALSRRARSRRGMAGRPPALRRWRARHGGRAPGPRPGRRGRACPRRRGARSPARSFAPAHVDLRLPSWTMRTNVPLDETLTVMGMPTAFTGDADFTGMTARERLYISAVLHQAFVAVDEGGLEAAPRRRSSRRKPGRPPASPSSSTGRSCTSSTTWRRPLRCSSAGWTTRR